MIAKSLDQLKRLWTLIFQRKGSEGSFTRLFENLDPPQRELLLRYVSLDPSELPVIGSVQGPDNWLILTTQRLEWSADGVRVGSYTDSILGVRMDLEAIRRKFRAKSESRHLEIVLSDGSCYTIELEPGMPLIGVWQVLRNLASRNTAMLRKGTV